MKKGPFIFTVVGSGKFPFDMLRYDSCWPYESGDAAKIAASGLRCIVLQTNNPNAPTYGRWQSFTWRATNYGAASEPSGGAPTNPTP